MAEIERSSSEPGLIEIVPEKEKHGRDWLGKTSDGTTSRPPSRASTKHSESTGMKIQTGAGSEREAIIIAKYNKAQVDALINSLELERVTQGDYPRFFEIEFKDPKHFAWMLIAFASMGGLLSGICQSIISGANLYLPQDLGITPRENSLVNAAVPLGAIAGAGFLSPLNEMFGRKRAIMISVLAFTVAAGLCAGAVDYGMLITGRLLLGFGVGLEGGTVPIYLSETVNKAKRGNIVSVYQFNITLGEVLGYTSAAIFQTVPGNWRYILGSTLLFSTMMGALMLIMPETPRWLMHKRRPLDAFKIWRRIKGIATSEAKEEFYVMKASLEEEETKIAAGTLKRRFPWLDFITVPRARRALIYANAMVGLGQLTGVNAVMAYMSVLFSQIGYSKVNANYLSLVGGGSLLIGTIPAIFLMETCGRRFWAISMLPGFFFGLVLIGISMYIPLSDLPAKQGVYITGLILYQGFFGSYACLTWIISAEVYPTYLRSYGMTTSAGWSFLTSFITVYNFSAMEEAFTGIGLLLGFYGGIAVVGWVYKILFMPETKGKSLEEIDMIFQRPTIDIVKENIVGIQKTMRAISMCRWQDVVVGEPSAEGKPQSDKESS